MYHSGQNKSCAGKVQILNLLLADGTRHSFVTHKNSVIFPCVCGHRDESVSREENIFPSFTCPGWAVVSRNSTILAYHGALVIRV